MRVLVAALALSGLPVPPSGDEAPRILIFPPFLSFASAVEAEVPGVELGVQNIHEAPSGAFTGEVSAGMAAEAGATLALVGHSERRHVFGEGDDRVAAKVVAEFREDGYLSD